MRFPIAHNNVLKDSRSIILRTVRLSFCFSIDGSATVIGEAGGSMRNEYEKHRAVPQSALHPRRNPHPTQHLNVEVAKERGNTSSKWTLQNAPHGEDPFRQRFSYDDTDGRGLVVLHFALSGALCNAT